MTKKMKILISIVVAVFVLGIVGTVTIMAQSPANPTTPPTTAVTPPVKPNINALVAAKLGIPEADLTNALKQARTNLAQSSTPAPAVPPASPNRPVRPVPIKPADLYAEVAKILNNPNITADKIAAAFQQVQKELRDQAINNSLDNAVKNGKITPDEENQIKGWYQSRPAALDKLGPLGPGPISPNLRGRMNNFQNRLNNLQNQFKNFRGKMNGMAPQAPPPASLPATGS